MPEVTHACPKRGSVMTPCCNKSFFELPLTDRITLHPERVTCKGGKKNANDSTSEES